MKLTSSEVKSLLHHREPYLLIDDVAEVIDNKIIVIKNHKGDEFYVKGHFPRASVVPGAMLQEMSSQAAGIMITKFHSPVENYNSDDTKGWALGVLNKVENAKYLGVVKPDKEIQIEVTLKESLGTLFKFRSIITQDNSIKAKINFNLVNISDEHLF